MSRAPRPATLCPPHFSLISFWCTSFNFSCITIHSYCFHRREQGPAHHYPVAPPAKAVSHYSLGIFDVFTKSFCSSLLLRTTSHLLSFNDYSVPCTLLCPQLSNATVCTSFELCQHTHGNQSSQQSSTRADGRQGFRKSFPHCFQQGLSRRTLSLLHFLIEFVTSFKALTMLSHSPSGAP